MSKRRENVQPLLGAYPMITCMKETHGRFTLVLGKLHSVLNAKYITGTVYIIVRNN